MIKIKIQFQFEQKFVKTNSYLRYKFQFQLSMRSSSPTREYPESIQKQATINSLRKQLSELQNVEHQYNAVQDEIQNAQTNYSLLAAEKDRVQSETQTKTDLNRRAISQLREDLNALEMQIHKCDTHITELMRQNQGLKRTCYNRDNQIASLISGNQELDKKNQNQYEINKDRTNQIKNLKDQRNRKQQEGERLENQLQESINNLKTLQKEARMLDSSVTRLQNILIMAEKDHSELIEEMKTRENVVEEQNRKLIQLQTQIQGLKTRTKILEQQCMKSQNQYRNVCDNLQSMNDKNKDLTKKLKTAQNIMRQTEGEHDRLVLQRDAYESDHLQLFQQNKILNEEIDRCLREILQYEKMNRQLQSQAHHFMQCDQQARQILNRKDRISNLLNEVTIKLNRTSEPISHLTGEIVQKRR